MTLVEHAERELALANVDEEVRPSIIEAVRAFTSFYGHSGGSASVCREILHDLLNYQALSPLTDDPAEWIDQSERSGYPLWQNVRDFEAMSEDGGKTYTLLREERRWVSVPLDWLPRPVRKRLPHPWIKYPRHRSVPR